MLLNQGDVALVRFTSIQGVGRLIEYITHVREPQVFIDCQMLVHIGIHKAAHALVNGAAAFVREGQKGNIPVPGSDKLLYGKFA